MTYNAVEIASRVRTGRMTATEVAIQSLERADTSQASLNAFTLIDHEGALARAAAIDELVTQGKDPGPLAGVPIALKDLIDQTGLPNTKGSSFPPEPAEHSATVVRRLGAAGANIIGRTGLHEFAFGFTSENPWFGPVRNPWDTDTSTGGSSGGSAAAVAAGIVPIGIGTDTGGSVRVPAAMCGTYGLKVTHGRVPLTGVYPLVGSFDTVGPLARSVDDLAAAYLAMAGDDPDDPWSQPVPVEPVPSLEDTSSVRIVLVEQWFDPPLSLEISNDITTFVDECDTAGFAVERLDMPTLDPIHAVTMASRAEILRVHREQFEADPSRYGADVQERLTESLSVTVEDLVSAHIWMSRARADIARLQTDLFTVIISPTVGVKTKQIGDDDVDVDGVSVFHRLALASFTSPANAIGIPALSAPILDSGQPPTSIQIVGPAWSESTLLALGRWFEKHEMIGFTPPPTVPHLGD
ncbi:MAG: AtzE family amidohydrolase [Acidimicrobiia bacterium]|nr:MAG: AtzE family amidohydrolase [Acidimicrobiia bacterium]